MKHSARRIAAFIALIIAFSPALLVARQTAPDTNALPRMSVWQARRIVTIGNSFWSSYPHSPIPNSIRFTPDQFEFDGAAPRSKPVHYVVDLRTLEEVSIKCRSHWQNKNSWCELKNAEGKPLQKTAIGGRWDYFFGDWEEHTVRFRCSEECAGAARLFATAINRLRSFAHDTDSPLRTFTQRAATWRATTPRPPLPEEVRLQRLLAEDAVKQRNPVEALNRYETGLELYPTWPEGYFNAALIAAELGHFSEAVEHMQSYLELVPDAQDAQSARDQIAIWQYKSKETR